MDSVLASHPVVPGSILCIGASKFVVAKALGLSTACWVGKWTAEACLSLSNHFLVVLSKGQARTTKQMHVSYQSSLKSD